MNLEIHTRPEWLKNDVYIIEKLLDKNFIVDESLYNKGSKEYFVEGKLHLILALKENDIMS